MRFDMDSNDGFSYLFQFLTITRPQAVSSVGLSLRPLRLLLHHHSLRFTLPRDFQGYEEVLPIQSGDDSGGDSRVLSPIDYLAVSPG
jgi:hypothetical protein